MARHWQPFDLARERLFDIPPAAAIRLLNIDASDPEAAAAAVRAALAMLDGLAVTPAVEPVAAQRPPEVPTKPEPATKPQPPDEKPQVVTALLAVWTGNLADDRLREIEAVASSPALSVEQKLQRIDNLLPIPPTASATALGRLLGVSAQAVKKTQWWTHNRRGCRKAAAQQREDWHRQRSQCIEPDYPEDD